MNVKIGNKVYSSHNEPIMLILSEDDKRNIQNMKPEATIFCVYPDSILEETVAQWMLDHLKGETK